MTCEDLQYEMQDAIHEKLLELELLQFVHTFEDRSLLTMDKGLVIATNEGDEFYVTIVRSKRPRA